MVLFGGGGGGGVKVFGVGGTTDTDFQNPSCPLVLGRTVFLSRDGMGVMVAGGNWSAVKRS